MAIASVPTGRPIIFIHGLWLHASSWGDWVKLFRRAGYEPSAPGWPGENPDIREARLEADIVADQGIDDVTEHYARGIRLLEEKPIVIGHSFGGLVAQKLLGEGLAAAAVAIGPAQPKGVWLLPFAQLRVILPVLINPFNINRTVGLSAGQFRYAFGNMLSNEESTELYTMWAIPSPARPLFASAFANLAPRSSAKVDTNNANRGSLLLVGAARDHTAPASVVRANFRLYRSSKAKTEYQEFAARGHSLIIDHHWREIADYVMDWLKQQKL